MNYVVTTVGSTDRYYSNIVAIDGQASNQPPTIPSNPTPSDYATNVSTNPSFSWTSTDPEGGQVYYIFLLGKEENSFSPEKSGTGTSASLSGLQSATTYYWRIESSDSEGKIKIGPIWRFTTAGQSTLSISPSTSRDSPHEFSSGGGSQNFTVSTNASSWTVYNNSSSKFDCYKSGNTVRISTINVNPVSELFGSVEITAGTETQIIYLKQKAAAALSSDATLRSLTVSGNTLSRHSQQV
jgi:hypothetical protein